MDTPVAIRRAETESHLRLKRLALLWAQANGYSACAAEVSLPQCRYRADVAAYRSRVRERTVTAIFECKQALPDLRDRKSTCLKSSHSQISYVVFCLKNTHQIVLQQLSE